MITKRTVKEVIKFVADKENVSDVVADIQTLISEGEFCVGDCDDCRWEMICVREAHRDE